MVRGREKFFIVVVVLAIVFGLLSLKSAVAAVAEGKRLLSELIAKAGKEGELKIRGSSVVAPRARELERAFLKRFGLNIKINYDTVVEEWTAWSKMHVALGTGLPPEFDAYEGNDIPVAGALDQKRLVRIDNWQDILAAINPGVGSGQVKPNQVSWEPFEGYGFAYYQRLHGVMYNRKLISKEELPRTRRDLANPKYKGRYNVASFRSMWLYGPVVYTDKDEWLEIVDRIGKNAGAVLDFAAGTQRVYLGEFAFVPVGVNLFYNLRAKDPGGPAGFHWFEDYVGVEDMFHAVPIRARHPAAATLFALWVTTPEAQEIWQPVLGGPNIRYGQTALDREVIGELESIKRRGGQVFSWFDNPETRALLDWFATKEGREYVKKIENALTQRR